MTRRVLAASLVGLLGCAVARGPAPGEGPLCLAIGQAHAVVGSPLGAFPRQPSCRADGGAMSSTLEMLLAAAISTLGGLALAGVF